MRKPVKAIQLNKKTDPDLMCRINRLASVRKLKPRTAFIQWLDENLPTLPKNNKARQENKSGQ